MICNLGVLEISVGDESPKFILFKNYKNAKTESILITTADPSLLCLKVTRGETQYTQTGYASVNGSIKRVVIRAYDEKILLPPKLTKNDIINKEVYCLMTNYKVGELRVKASICKIFYSEEELKDFAHNAHVYTEEEAERCTLNKFYTMDKIIVISLDN